MPHWLKNRIIISRSTNLKYTTMVENREIENSITYLPVHVVTGYRIARDRTCKKYCCELQVECGDEMTGSYDVGWVECSERAEPSVVPGRFVANHDPDDRHQHHSIRDQYRTIVQIETPRARVLAYWSPVAHICMIYPKHASIPERMVERIFVTGLEHNITPTAVDVYRVPRSTSIHGSMRI